MVVLLRHVGGKVRYRPGVLEQPFRQRGFPGRRFDEDLNLRAVRQRLGALHHNHAVPDYSFEFHGKSSKQRRHDNLITLLYTDVALKDELGFLRLLVREQVPDRPTNTTATPLASCRQITLEPDSRLHDSVNDSSRMSFACGYFSLAGATGLEPAIAGSTVEPEQWRIPQDRAGQGIAANPVETRGEAAALWKEWASHRDDG